MSTEKQRQRRPAAKRHEPDWEALRALTDEEIAAQIAANRNSRNARNDELEKVDDQSLSIDGA